jgi:hypothetical protein
MKVLESWLRVFFQVPAARNTSRVASISQLLGEAFAIFFHGRRRQKNHQGYHKKRGPGWISVAKKLWFMVDIT